MGETQDFDFLLPTFKSQLDILMLQINRGPTENIGMAFFSMHGENNELLAGPNTLTSTVPTTLQFNQKLAQFPDGNSHQKIQKANNVCSSIDYKKKKGKNVTANIKEPIISYFEKMNELSYLPVQQLKNSHSVSLQMLKNICQERRGSKIIMRMIEQKYLFRQYQQKRFSSDRKYGLHFTRINEIQRSLLQEIKKNYQEEISY